MGDYDLAQKAFKVMRDGTYDFGYIDGYNYDNEDEINKFFGMFDYLHDRVLKTRGEEKDAAMEALNRLFNKIPSMPDEIAAEIPEKLSQVAAEYVDQKSNERDRYLHNISLETQFRVFISEKMYNMKYYNPEEKRYSRCEKEGAHYNAHLPEKFIIENCL